MEDPASPAKGKLRKGCLGCLGILGAGMVLLTGIGIIAGVSGGTSGTRAPMLLGSPQKFTKAKYDAIREGMTYAQVVGILGENGTEQASNRIEGVPGVMAPISTKMYMWQNGDGSNINAMFQNDKLMQKAQFGLK